MTDTTEPSGQLEGQAEPRVTRASTIRKHFKQIIARHATGESLQEIGQSLDPPCTGLQLRRTIITDPELTASFNAVIEHRAHYFIEEAARLAALCGKAGDVAGMKVAISAYTTLAGKIAPRLYGDKSTLELVGAGGGPVKHTVELDPAEAYRKMIGGQA
jgi:hypothetical protein